MSVFSERLKLIMGERGITQAKLSELTGIPKSAISQYLADKFKPRRDRTYLLCRTLNADPAWLLGLNGDKLPFTEVSSASLDEDEMSLIFFYRNHPELHETFMRIIGRTENQTVFRAAKSKSGTVAPGLEKISPERIRKLTSAPETDEDI